MKLHSPERCLEKGVPSQVSPKCPQTALKREMLVMWGWHKGDVRCLALRCAVPAATEYGLQVAQMAR